MARTREEIEKDIEEAEENIQSLRDSFDAGDDSLWNCDQSMDWHTTLESLKLELAAHGS